MIVEVEAYGGPPDGPWPDAASHSFRGRRGRNTVMFGPAGRLYTYRSHGIHVCANVVCGYDGVAGAVLLRAAAVESGTRRRRARRGDSVRPAALARGPGNLCSALGITMDDNGIDLFDARQSGPAHAGGGAPRMPTGPRVGVSQAADRPWRFWLAGRPEVSLYRRSPRAPAPGQSDWYGKIEVMGTSNILDELEWRGLIAQSTDRDALGEQLAAGPVTVYSGFDPTAPSLHAGHLIPLLTLRRFQQAGHRPIVLAGGATGMIGDPRDTGERTLNTAATVADWTDRIRGQLERFVDFDDSPSGAVVENNLSWTGDMWAIEFLRDIGKHFSVNVMLDRDTVRRRLEGEGISYTEFSYMLLQANDYVELHRRYGCTLQIGGSDQWGNIIAGVRLGAPEVRRDGPCVDHAVGHRLRRQQVRKVDRRRQSLARPGDDQPVRLVPVLHQYRRCGRDPLSKWFTFLSADEVADLEQATADGPTSGRPSAGWRRSSPPWCMGRRSVRRSNTPARRCSGEVSWRNWMSRRWRRRCGRPATTRSPS